MSLFFLSRRIDFDWSAIIEHKKNINNIHKLFCIIYNLYYILYSIETYIKLNYNATFYLKYYIVCLMQCHTVLYHAILCQYV